MVDGAVFIGSGNGLFYALDLATGTPRWTYQTAGVEFNSAEFGYDRKQIMGSAAVRDGTVYFGSRDASLYALDAVTGQVRWHREDGSAWVMNSPAVSDAVVVNARSSSTNVRALDPATGDERWVVEAGAVIFSSPTLVGATPAEGSRNTACLALGKIGPAANAALPALRNALSDSSPDVRRFAQRAIERIDVSP